jgi:hypothetical protein
MREYVAKHGYAPSQDLGEIAAELYEEVGDIAMTLIRAKIKRVRDRLWPSTVRSGQFTEQSSKHLEAAYQHIESAAEILDREPTPDELNVIDSMAA